MAIDSACFTVTKCRGGYHIVASGEYDEDNDEPGESDSFVIPGDDLDPTELGKQIIASLVALRVGKKGKRR